MPQEPYEPEPPTTRNGQADDGAGLVTPGQVLRHDKRMADLFRRLSEIEERNRGRDVPFPDDSPEAVRESVRALQRERAWSAWERLVDEWPDDDLTRVTASRLDPGQHPEQLGAWIDSGARSLFLVGNIGTGKTFAGFAALREFARRGTLVHAVTQKRHLDALRPGGSPDLAWVIHKQLREAPVLLYDDLGAEMDQALQSEWVRQQMVDFLSARMGPGKRNIFTTNETPKALGAMFNGRVVSRLMQDKRFVEISGPDRRQEELPDHW